MCQTSVLITACPENGVVDFFRNFVSFVTKHLKFFLTHISIVAIVRVSCLEHVNQEELEMSEDQVNGSVEALANAFRNVIVEAVGPLHEKIDRLERKVDDLARRVDALERRMDSLEHRMDSLENRMDSLEHRMDGLEREVKVLEQNIGVTNQNMSAQFAAQAKYISGEIDKKLSRLAA